MRTPSVNGAISGLIGATVEAWAQLRIGKMRVLLSLVGVAVAVAAMSFVIAFGDISSQAQKDMMERWSGKPGTVQIHVTPANSSGAGMAGPGGSFGVSDDTEFDPSQADQKKKIAEAQADFLSRYEITYWDSFYTTKAKLVLAGEPLPVNINVVDGSYAVLHRSQVEEGRWFRADDEDDMSPSMVISRSIADQLGIDKLTTPVKIQGVSPVKATYTIVGIIADTGNQECYGTGSESTCTPVLEANVLAGPYERLLPPHAVTESSTLEVWGGTGTGKEMEKLATTYFDGIFGHGSTSAYSNEYDDMENFDRVFQLVVAGGGIATMLLGALGLINISIVTVRQRIHEIGVRRSFGATSRRIFFSIMMESVVATVVAGVVGIMIAIIGMQFVPWEKVLGTTLSQTPSFPLSAAFLGLLSATVVGALAGIIPAVIAVRIKPIDAIRF